MTQTEPELVADPATEPTGGAEPIDATATEPADESAAVEQHRPGVRPRGDATHLIAGTDLLVVPPTNELDAIAQMAVTFAAAGVVPTALRSKPNDVFLVLMTARDLGMGLTTAMRECHVIEGKVTISPKCKLAMVRQQGLGRIWPDPGNDGEGATWYAERNDQPGVQHRYTFTKAMATAAGLLPGKDKSAWKTYPERMLSWRACGYLLDDVFGEVGTGLYSPDELGAVTDADGQVVIDVVGSAEPLAGMSAPRGHNAPPPPPEEPATADQIAGLRKRIHALPNPDGRKALLALWGAPRSDEDPRPKLPMIDQLMAKQVKIADAMVASIEQRAKRGEWGDWEPATEAEQATTDAPAADDTQPDAPSGEQPTVDEQPADDQAQADEPPADDAPNTEEITRLVIAEVKAMEPDQVDDALATRQLDTTGRLDTRRHRLAKAMIGERTNAAG